MASRKILAVDDSVSIRKSISFILGQENFEVVVMLPKAHLTSHSRISGSR